MPVDREEVCGGKRAQAWQENSAPGEHLLQPSPPLGGRAYSKRGGGRKPRLGGRTPLPGRTTLPLPPQPRQVGSGRISEKKKKADLPPRGSGGRKWGFFGLALCRPFWSWGRGATPRWADGSGMGRNSAWPCRTLLQIGELRPRARPRESMRMAELHLCRPQGERPGSSWRHLALRSGKLFAGH